MEVGWYSYRHLADVCGKLIEGSHSTALERIEEWQIRGNVPAAVVATRIILNEMIKIDHDLNIYQSNQEVNLLSMAFIRSLNLLLDQGQTMLYSKSISVIAKDMGIPEQLIQIRHNCCHGNVPDFHSIYQAIKYLFNLILNNYWIPQLNIYESKTSPEFHCLLTKELIDGKTGISGYNNDKFISVVALDLLVSEGDSRMQWINTLISRRGLDFAICLYSRAVGLLLNLNGWYPSNRSGLTSHSWTALEKRLKIYREKFDHAADQTSSSEYNITRGFNLKPLLELLCIDTEQSQSNCYYVIAMSLLLRHYPEKMAHVIKGLMDFSSKMLFSGYNDMNEVKIVWKAWRSLMELLPSDSYDNTNLKTLIETTEKTIYPDSSPNNKHNQQNTNKTLFDVNKTYTHLLSVGTYFSPKEWCLHNDEPDPSHIFLHISPNNV